MNPLQQYPVLRQWAYRLVWLAGLVLGAVQVWFGTTDAPQPSWLLPALAVLAYVSVATNYTADKNVSTVLVPPGKHVEGAVNPEGGYSPIEWAIGVLVFLVVLVVLLKLLGLL